MRFSQFTWGGVDVTDQTGFLSVQFVYQCDFSCPSVCVAQTAVTRLAYVKMRYSIASAERTAVHMYATQCIHDIIKLS